MRNNVVYSKVALRDLDRVWSEVYEASLSSDVTDKYINDLLDKVEDKAAFPRSGSPLYYEDGFTGYYYIVFRAYLIFYRVDGNTMFVDRVLFGRSDYMRNLHLNIEMEL